MKKAQKLTTLNKQQHSSFAKTLVRKFGARKNSHKWKWDKIVTTDFSGISTIEGIHNSKNDVFYGEDSSELSADLKEAPIVKYRSDVMFSSAITTKSLILQDGPINFTQWL
ncbi:unnamed protein product [Rotaria sp. Silwood1]|nr:unnamed protein product [Rotaria sp. Silwood1]CAF3921722.1 unnamed protein product [Rotaria sp. Silwood1]CAF4051465.1 unnamed protein product [Rotaria sp. Silwood1]CAF4919453.1 unnamed protein product [Rotaria sp. Silwood1]CAF4961743.1 unnamed protein product [Rotaria sp. Silwood1]